MRPTETALTLQKSGSVVTALMAAPVERIFGEARDATDGELFLELGDLRKLRGLVRVDLDHFILSQQKRATADGEFGEKVTQPRQNEHMKNWLEIGADAPEEVREDNRWATMRIDGLRAPSVASLADRRDGDVQVRAEAFGSLRLHGRTVPQSMALLLDFHFDRARLTRVKIASAAPMNLSLEAYDVRPREAFGKLAQATLGAIGQKVAPIAALQLTLSAVPKS